MIPTNNPLQLNSPTLQKFGSVSISLLCHLHIVLEQQIRLLCLITRALNRIQQLVVKHIAARLAHQIAQRCLLIPAFFWCHFREEGRVEFAIVHFEVDHDAMLAHFPIQGVLGCFERVEEGYFALQLGDLFQRQRFKSTITESTMPFTAKLEFSPVQSVFLQVVKGNRHQAANAATKLTSVLADLF